MTIISTVISRFGVVHATDSLITTLSSGGVYSPISWRWEKLIRVPMWKGIMSFWGLAKINRYGWSTITWLENQVHNTRGFRNPESFAVHVASELNKELSRMGVANNTNAGIGIHFTAYENINGNNIPELFLISNWADPTYSSLRVAGVEATRETSATVLNSRDNIGGVNIPNRINLYNWLQAGNYITYNNGDPLLYNSAANAMTGMVQVLKTRNILKSVNRLDTYVKISRFPVDTVTHMQKQLCKRGTQIVGGRTRDISVNPTGTYLSTSGD